MRARRLIGLILLAAGANIMASNAQFLTDGDAAFVKVDTRRPAHELEPGVCADAVNKRFEDGRAWPRYGVNCQAWGKPAKYEPNLVPGGAAYGGPVGPGAGHFYTLLGLTVGREYLYSAGNATQLTDAAQLFGSPGAFRPAGNTVKAGRFVATQAQYFIWGPNGAGVSASVQLVRKGKPCGFARWSDPNGIDNLVLVTDDWRNLAGEDGGRGRAWRIHSGQGPIAIPLNGHDADGTSRLIPCNGGLALLRQGNERHYFAAPAVNTGTTQIQLNCAPAWVNGERVFFWADLSVGSAIVGTAAPNADTEYWVKNIAGNKVELYTDGGLTVKLNAWTAAIGRFYLERRSDTPGFFGNGYPTLLMQPLAGGATAFEAGFFSAAVNVVATALDASNKILTVANHRLIPGDKVQYVHSGTPTAYFAFPLNAHQVELCANATDALSGANPQTLAFTANDYLYKDGASGQPLPPGREGIFTKNNRLIVVNGRNNLGISDPLDPLHFTPFQATITADGDADVVNELLQLGDDQIVIAKENRIRMLDNFSAGPAGWTLKNVTDEYGIIAPLTLEPVGQDAWGLSRKGVVSVRQTETGQVYGVALPVSQDLKKYIDLVDWSTPDGAPRACAKTWNNRYFIALPKKGQTAGTKTNNMVLVYNTLNAGWEGMWTGASLNIYCFARHLVFGEERLCFANADGEVCWFGEGFTDALPGQGYAAIADSLTTRIYTKGNQDPKLWLKGHVIWDTSQPKLTVRATSPGHNEEDMLLDGKEYDPAKYSVYGQADYNPASATAADFDKANRQDYSLTPGEVLIGEVDVHQNTTEGLRMRVNDWGVQLVIENEQGSARVQAVNLSYVPSLKTASRQT